MADKDSRSGSRYGTADVVKWVDELHVPHDPALKAAFDAPDREGMPAIQVGVAEAKAINLMLRLLGARKVVELGTLAGFSAIQIARALPPDGHLWTIELEDLHVRVARDRIAGAGLADRVTVVQGSALEVLASLEPHGPFDAIFLDADKGNYDKYGRWAAAHLRQGGLLLADNAYFFGDLLDPNKPEAEAMRRFHEESKGPFDTVCLPTPDGLLVGLRR
jgi:caffeoyl-CoA O-methyltransferase